MKTILLLSSLLISGCSASFNAYYENFKYAETLCEKNEGVKLIIQYSRTFNVLCNNGAKFSNNRNKQSK